MVDGASPVAVVDVSAGPSVATSDPLRYNSTDERGGVSVYDGKVHVRVALDAATDDAAGAASAAGGNDPGAAGEDTAISAVKNRGVPSNHTVTFARYNPTAVDPVSVTSSVAVPSSAVSVAGGSASAMGSAVSSTVDPDTGSPSTSRTVATSSAFPPEGT